MPNVSNVARCINRDNTLKPLKWSYYVVYKCLRFCHLQLHQSNESGQRRSRHKLWTAMRGSIEIRYGMGISTNATSVAKHRLSWDSYKDSCNTPCLAFSWLQPLTNSNVFEIRNLSLLPAREANWVRLQALAWHRPLRKSTQELAPLGRFRPCPPRQSNWILNTHQSSQKGNIRSVHGFTFFKEHGENQQLAVLTLRRGHIVSKVGQQYSEGHFLTASHTCTVYETHFVPRLTVWRGSCLWALAAFLLFFRFSSRFPCALSPNRGFREELIAKPQLYRGKGSERGRGEGATCFVNGVATSPNISALRLPVRHWRRRTYGGVYDSKTDSRFFVPWLVGGKPRLRSWGVSGRRPCQWKIKQNRLGGGARREASKM